MQKRKDQNGATLSNATKQDQPKVKNGHLDTYAQLGKANEFQDG
jgi:hypothetical protein